MKKVSKKKEITLDDLAMMTQRGFDVVHSGMKEANGEMKVIKSEMKEMEERLGIRLDKLEYLLIGRHDKRLDKLEDDMRVIKTLLEKKLGRPISKR